MGRGERGKVRGVEVVHQEDLLFFPQEVGQCPQPLLREEGPAPPAEVEQFFDLILRDQPLELLAEVEVLPVQKFHRDRAAP